MKKPCHFRVCARKTNPCRYPGVCQTTVLIEQNNQLAKLDKLIRANLEDIGYGEWTAPQLVYRSFA